MAKIYAPYKQYNGISASVAFARGVGETENPTLLEWFREHGYTVEVEEAPKEEPPKEEPPKEEPPKEEPPITSFNLEEMDVDQLRVYAAEHSIELGNATSVNGILKKITEAEKETSKDAEKEVPETEKAESLEGEEGEQEV